MHNLLHFVFPHEKSHSMTSVLPQKSTHYLSQYYNIIKTAMKNLNLHIFLNNHNIPIYPLPFTMRNYAPPSCETQPRLAFWIPAIPAAIPNISPGMPIEICKERLGARPSRKCPMKCAQRTRPDS